MPATVISGITVLYSRHQGLVRAAAAGIFAYEAASIAFGRTPTVSKLCHRYHWAEVALMGILIAHIHHDMKDTP